MLSRTLRLGGKISSNTAYQSLVGKPVLLKLRLSTPTQMQQKMGQSTSSELDSSYQFKNYNFDSILKLVQEAPKDGPLLIDTREASELAEQGKIPSALNVPYKSAPGSFNLNPEEFKELYSVEKPNKDQELIFYCAAGIRAKSAAELAHSFGYSNCSVYPGSYNEWTVRKGPIEH